MVREDTLALDAVRNLKKALLDEILARFPFGKPEPVDSKKVEKFVEVVLKWLILDDEELRYLLQKKPDTLKLDVTVTPTGGKSVKAKWPLGREELLAAWVNGRTA